MISLKPRQIRAARKSIGRAGSWLAAWLIVFVSSAFALRDPITLEVAVLRAVDLIDASHDHHHDHAQPQTSKKFGLSAAHHDHVSHDHRDCPLCGAPALASGAPDAIAARGLSIETTAKLSNHSVLHVESEHCGSTQPRAPPFSPIDV